MSKASVDGDRCRILMVSTISTPRPFDVLKRRPLLKQLSTWLEYQIKIITAAEAEEDHRGVQDRSEEGKVNEDWTDLEARVIDIFTALRYR